MNRSICEQRLIYITDVWMNLNMSLTAIGLFWTATDFIAKGLIHGPCGGKGN